MGHLFWSHIGIVQEVQYNGVSLPLGVIIDLTNLLQQVVKAVVDEVERDFPLQYERLPNFFYFVFARPCGFKLLFLGINGWGGLAVWPLAVPPRLLF